MELYQRKQLLEIVDSLSRDYLQGKYRAIRTALICLLAGGHLLIEDLPGLGKTSLALALAGTLDLDFGRIQCTSDLVPSDITGLSIFDQKKNHFRFVRGPIFNNLLLVDEINRTTPKTQSAMLEAMEEARVTVEGETYPLPDPFMVIATQNPLDQVGTFPLPEAQLDRFLLKTDIGYPSAALEKEIIRNGSARDALTTIQPLLQPDKIRQTRQFIRDEIKLHNRVVDYIYQLLDASRNEPRILSGISTRGGLSLAAAAKVVAYLEGRDFVIPEDVQHVAPAVASHRILLNPEFQMLRKEEVLKSLLEKVAVPIA